MIELIVALLLLLAALTILIASFAMVRFNGLYARMHVVTKVSSFAFLLLLLAMNLYFLSWKVALVSLVIFHVLVFLSPISAHVVAKVSKMIEKSEK
jgi:multicomponent Na+:H+ antiporter subunit G